MTKIAFATAVLIFSSATAHAESGIASRYGGDDGLCGGPIASGRLIERSGRLNCSALHAAHKTLRFGAMVRVTNLYNRRSVVVEIVDRGPFVRGRIIDVTPAAAHVLGFSGLAPVSLEIVSR